VVSWFVLLIRAFSRVFVQVTVTGKADRIIAERAQRQRKEAKLATRRSAYKDSLDQVLEEERTALMRKHAMMSASTAAHSHGTSYSRGNTTAGSTGAPMTPAALAAMTGSNVLMS
jgi:2-oxo-4-hydroxy-4-carboxy--5-ureidoimidazoline (OHCU) decarboxylase